MQHSVETPALEGKRWHVAVVKPQLQYREIAQKALKARGYGVFLPMCREMVVKDGKSVAVEHTMFGRYLFVGVEPGQDSWEIRWTPGIQHMTLDARRRPVTVGVTVLQAILSRMIQDGGIVNLCPKPAAIGSGFIPGQRVRISDGALSGWEGLFQGDQGERCRVLLNVAGPESALVVPAKDLVAA